MPGTTPFYSFPYPTSSDLAKNGASAIQSLAQAVEDLLDGSATKPLLRFTSDTTSTSQTHNNNTYTNKTDCQVLNFPLGPSGKFLVLLWAAGNHPTSGQGVQARVALSGAFTGNTDEITLRNTANITGLTAGLFTGTANGNLTATLAMRSTDNTSCTITNATLWVVALG